MPRVALLTQFFPPERNAPANRVGAIASGLASRVELQVFTVAPSYPDPASFAHLDVESVDRQMGITVHRLPPFAAHGGVVSRALREMDLVRRLVSGARAARPDVVWVSAPTMFLIPAAVRLGASVGARTVIDVRDLTWAYVSDSEVAGSLALRSAAVVLGRWMERSLGGADVVVVTNEGARDAVHRAGVLVERIEALPNGIDRARFEELAELVTPSGRRRRPLISYCGLVGHNQGLTTVADVAEALPGCDFAVAGGGPGLPELAERIRVRGLHNVRLLGQIAWAEVKEVYRESDILFAQLRSQTSLARTAVPSKIFEYMAAGRPVVYAGGGVAADMVRGSRAGAVVDAEDWRAIAGAVERLVADPSMREAMARAGRQFAACHIREAWIDQALPRILSRVAPAG